MIFSHAIWNKQVLVNFFKKPQIALALQAHTILLVFKKIYLHLFTAFILTNQNWVIFPCILLDLQYCDLGICQRC